MKSVQTWIAAFIFALMTAGFFYRTILFHTYPIPSDTLVGLYHPWRDEFAKEYPRGVPFRNFLITDPIRQQIPWRKVVIDAWKTHTGGMWNPYTFLGVPLDANIQAAPFYPFNLLFLFMPFQLAWTMLIIVQPFLASVLLFLFLRHHKLSVISSIFAGMVWAFSGFSMTWLTWGTMLQTALWIPAILLSVDHMFMNREHGKKTFGWSLKFVFSSIMMLFAGHIQIAAYGCVLVFLYIVWKRPSRQVLTSLLPVLCAVGLVGAVQLNPFIRLVLDSGRSGAFDNWKMAGWFLPWQHLAGFIAPDFFGNPATLNYWGVWNYGELTGYVGVVPLLLAMGAFGLTGLPSFFIIILGLSLVFVLPNPVSMLPFIVRLPIVSVLQPTRLLMLIDLSLAILAGYGLERLVVQKRLSTTGFGIGALGLMTLWSIALIGKYVIHDNTIVQNLAVSARNLVVPTALFIAGGMFMAVIVRKKSHKISAAVLLFLSILTLFDLFRFGWKFTPFSQSSYFFPETDVIRFLKGQEKPFRVMSVDDRILPPNVSAYFGIESVEGYDPIAPIRYERFVASSEQKKPLLTGNTGFNRIYTAHSYDSPLVPYFNARFILALTDMSEPGLTLAFRSGDVRVYESNKAFPRAYVAEEVMRETSDEETLNTLLSKPGRLGIYHGRTDIMNIPLSSEEIVVIKGYTDNMISLSVRTKNPRLLVVLNRYDPRWHASIDGTVVPILRTNYIFSGIPIPQGDHNVILSYY